MNILFRVDSSSSMGIGHLSRCLALANCLVNSNHTVYFISRPLKGNRSDLVEANKIPTFFLPYIDINYNQNDYLSWLGTSQKQDAVDTISVIKSNITSNIDLLIVDHYALDHQWHKYLKPLASKILVIDDLANRKLLCDIVLDQTPGRKAIDYKLFTPQTTHFLCGSQFALLRPEFSRVRKQSTQRRFDSPLSITIFLGGTDPDNVTSQIISSINLLSSNTISDITLISAQTPPNTLTKQLDESHHKSRVIVNSKNIAELYSNTDLVIGSGGVSALERCVVGAPSLQYIYAENQESIADELTSKGAAITITTYRNPDFQHLPDLIRNLAKNNQLLQTMSDVALTICDGNGIQRVVTNILSFLKC